MSWEMDKTAEVPEGRKRAYRELLPTSAQVLGYRSGVWPLLHL